MAPFSFRLLVPAKLSAFLGATMLLVACEDDPKESRPSRDLEKLPLLDPELPLASGETRCRPAPESKSVLLRAPAQGESGGAVEVGGAAAVAGGFVVGTLKGQGSTQAQLTWTDGYGKERTVDLGRVHGAVEPPLVEVHHDDVLVALTDNDAMHTNIRLARVSGIATSPEVIWGPEIQTRREESAAVTMGVLAGSEPAAVVLWDDYDPRSAVSQIRLMRFSPQTMKGTGPVTTLSAPGEDAVEPRVAVGEDETWATWLSYEEMKKDSAKNRGSLVSEPARGIRATRLEETGLPLGPPVALTKRGSQVLAYDVSAGPLLTVAFRDEELGRPLGAVPIRLRSLGLSGSVVEGEVAHQNLGPGAPLLLSAGSLDTWIFSRGNDREVLWAKVKSGMDAPGFDNDPGLSGTIPLARSGEKLLVVEPSGIDLRLTVRICAPSKTPTK